MKVADQIAKWMADKEITHAFGIIGGGNVALWDAIARLAKTQIICMHHEQAAAMAGAYYFRTAGRIAPVLVTTGAGSSNAITGVLAAWMDSTPLLVISGNEASKHMGAPTRVWGVQGYGSSELVRPIVKAAVRASAPDTAIGSLEGAYELCLSERHGPVWVDVPKDVQNAVR